MYVCMFVCVSWELLGAPGSFWDLLGALGTFWDPLGPSGSFWDFFAFFADLHFRQKLIKIEGFRASRRSHGLLLEILLKIRLTRAPEAFSKPVS